MLRAQEECPLEVALSTQSDVYGPHMLWWACAVVGAAVGPALAALTAWVHGSQRPAVGWWHGEGASVRRVIAVTAANVFVAVGLGWRIGAMWALPAYIGAGIAGVALAVIDWETYRLPNAVVLPLYAWCAGWLATAAAVSGDWAALFRAAVCGLLLAAFGLLVALLNPGRFGLGDCKLLGVLGVLLGWLSWWAALYGPMAGFLLGAFWSVGIVVLRGRQMGAQFAFGPSLLVGAFLTLIII